MSVQNAARSGAPDFRSAVAKLNRANKYLEVLKRLVSDFIQPDLYRTETKSQHQVAAWTKYSASQLEELGFRDIKGIRKVDDDTFLVPLVATIYGLLVTVHRTPPVDRWGALIGDILNNTRGALDNVVWALTDAHVGPPQIRYPRVRRDVVSEQWRQVRFPVAHSNNAWNDAVKNNLWGLRPRDKARIKKLQPYYRRKRPDRHWLALLEELWVADKHRTIALLRDYHGWSNLTVDLWLPGQEFPMTADEFAHSFTIKLIRRRLPGPFENETEEIARFRVAPRVPIQLMRGETRMEVKCRLAFDIAFDQGPTSGQLVVATLEQFLNHAAAVLAEFQPDSS